MSAAVYVAIAAIGFALLLFVSQQVRIYLRFRGARVITCPETEAPAGVVVDARHAASTAMRDVSELRLQSCSRWPERAGCDQECLRQIEAAPEDCLLRNILTRWYLGKKCFYCKQPLEEIHWTQHKPALMSPAGTTVEWSQVRPEEVFTLLNTYMPVCWRCHIVQTFCRERPELMVDRSRVWPQPK